jgi:hypothetical protein
LKPEGAMTCSVKDRIAIRIPFKRARAVQEENETVATRYFNRFNHMQPDHSGKLSLVHSNERLNEKSLMKR